MLSISLNTQKPKTEVSFNITLITNYYMYLYIRHIIQLEEKYRYIILYTRIARQSIFTNEIV